LSRSARPKIGLPSEPSANARLLGLTFPTLLPGFLPFNVRFAVERLSLPANIIVDGKSDIEGEETGKKRRESEAKKPGRKPLTSEPTTANQIGGTREIEINFRGEIQERTFIIPKPEIVGMGIVFGFGDDESPFLDFPPEVDFDFPGSADLIGDLPGSRAAKTVRGISVWALRGLDLGRATLRLLAGVVGR
jgi:hypothetical protein